MANIIDFTAKLNERRAAAVIQQREQEKQEVIDNHIEAGREALAVGDIVKAMEHAAEVAKAEEGPVWMPAYCDPNNKFEGSKYAATKHLSTGEIPALMRQDIKDAIKRGQLPKGIKVSVRKERCTYSWSIRITVTALPEGFKVYNREYLRFTDNLKHPPVYPEDWDCCGQQAPLHHIEGGVYSKEMQAIQDVLEAIHNAYQMDNSDSMSDYFHVRYYGDVYIEHDLGKGETWQQ